MHEMRRLLATFAAVVTLWPTGVVRGDVPPPLPRCKVAGAECRQIEPGILGQGTDGICVAAADGTFYCDVGGQCFPALGPGRSDASYNSVPCKSILPPPPPLPSPTQTSPSPSGQDASKGPARACACTTPGTETRGSGGFEALLGIACLSLVRRRRPYSSTAPR